MKRKIKVLLVTELVLTKPSIGLHYPECCPFAVIEAIDMGV